MVYFHQQPMCSQAFADIPDPTAVRVQSLERDRRNVYGQNDKASRKAIPRRKADARRSYRHAARQEIHEALGAVGDGLDAVESRVAAVARKSWRKSPDCPLGQVIKWDLERRRAREPLPQTEARVKDLVRRWRAEAAVLLDGQALQANGWTLEPAEVRFGSGTLTHAVGAYSQRSGSVTAAHPPTGIELSARWPEGIYTSGQVGALQDALKLKLYAELQEKVGDALQIPGRTARSVVKKYPPRGG